jgi:hypothetical protein
MTLMKWTAQLVTCSCMIFCACSRHAAQQEKPQQEKQMIADRRNVDIYIKVLARFLNKYLPTHADAPKTFYLNIREAAFMRDEIRKLCNVEIKPGDRVSPRQGMLIDNDTGFQCGKLEVVDATEPDGRRFIGVAAIIGNMGAVGVSYRIENRPGGWEIVEEKYGFSM